MRSIFTRISIYKKFSNNLNQKFIFPFINQRSKSCKLENNELGETLIERKLKLEKEFSKYKHDNIKIKSIFDHFDMLSWLQKQGRINNNQLILKPFDSDLQKSRKCIFNNCIPIMLRLNNYLGIHLYNLYGMSGKILNYKDVYLLHHDNNFKQVLEKLNTLMKES
jgi:hypothetical protein